MYLTHRIEELALRHDDARRAIGDFVLENHDHLDDFTIADIAEATFTSKPTVVRFAKTLGFSGWRDFLRAFMQEERRRERNRTAVDVNLPFTAENTDEQIIQAIGDLSAEAIADTFALLDRGALKRAVLYLQRATSVAVFGIAPNSFVADLFCRKLLSIGKQAHTVPDGEYGITARSLGPDDLAVVISYSGDNPNANPLRQIPTLMNRRVMVIGLTSAGHNYLRETVPCTFTISSHEHLYAKVANFATEESINYILNALFACLFARDYERNLAYRIEGARQLEDERKVSLEELRAARPLPRASFREVPRPRP